VNVPPVGGKVGSCRSGRKRRLRFDCAALLPAGRGPGKEAVPQRSSKSAASRERWPADDSIAPVVRAAGSVVRPIPSRRPFFWSPVWRRLFRGAARPYLIARRSQRFAAAPLLQSRRKIQPRASAIAARNRIAQVNCPAQFPVRPECYTRMRNSSRSLDIAARDRCDAGQAPHMRRNLGSRPPESHQSPAGIW